MSSFPCADCKKGVVFIKNTSADTVTVKAFTSSKETDKIEGSATKKLKKQYDSHPPREILNSE